MIRNFFSLFKKQDAKPVAAPGKKKRKTSTTHDTTKFKKELKSLKEHSTALHSEIAEIKNHVRRIPDHSEHILQFEEKHAAHEKTLRAHADTLAKFEVRHGSHEKELQAHEKTFLTHSERFHAVEGKLADQRIDLVEVKSRLNELSHSLSKVEGLIERVAAIEVRHRVTEEAPERTSSVKARVARAKAPAGSALEAYHSLAPHTKKILSLLLSMHMSREGKWIPLLDLRRLVYPGGENSNSTQAAMAKAIRPLYEAGFVEKKRNKSFVYVAATKRGREAAKEVGLMQQAEKFDEAFAKLEE